MPKKLLALVFVTILSNLAWSQSYQLGQASLSGNGCLPGKAAITVSPDLTSVSILFDDFNVDASGSLGKDRSFKTTCTVVIPVTVTPGYTVETATIDYRGFTDLDSNAIATITTYANRNDAMNGVRFGKSKTVRGPVQEIIFARHIVEQQAGYKRCPVVSQIYLGIAAQINTVAKQKRGLFTLDSGDVGGEGVTLGIVLKPCRP